MPGGGEVDSARSRALPAGEASVPQPARAWDHQQVKASVKKLTTLNPAKVLTGHADPLIGEDLTSTLRTAADRC